MNRLSYSLLFLVAVFCVACNSESRESLSEPENHQKVVLAFDIQGISQSLGTQSWSYEDNIDQVTVFIFNSATAEKVYEDSFQRNSAYQVRIKPGTYDFYFIANETDLPLYKMSRDDLDYRLKEKTLFSGQFGHTNLPMARVYKKQKIDSGGTAINPQRFTPELSDATPLSPISSFGQDRAIRGQVSLVRAVAKVSVLLKGEGVPYVAKVEYAQATSNYSLMELPDELHSTRMMRDIPFQKTAPESLGKYSSIYIPERLFSKSEKVGWSRDASQNLDEPIGQINYLKITMYGGTVYKIPVIANGHEATTTYLDLARDGSRADYNIIRNFDYQYTLTIPLANRELQVKSVVAPWRLVDSEMSFNKPHVALGLSGGVMTASALEVDDQENLIFRLNVTRANGLTWRVALSNGLDFELVPYKEGNDLPATTGVGSDNTTYSFKLQPLKPYQGTPRFTELYLIVNGQEVSLFNNIEGVGPGKRLLIKQVQVKG